MNNTALLLKHYRLLAKNIDSLSDGQAWLKPTDEDSDQEDTLTTILVRLAPRSGPYRGGQFDFELDLSDGYPASPPLVRAVTPIYHPNIDYYDDCSEGEVCLNLLDELWSADMSLEDVVQGLLFLLHEPNLEDPLSSVFNGTEDEEEFYQTVRQSLRGGMEIEGLYFERNLVDGYTSDNEEENDSTPGNQDANPAMEKPVLTEATECSELPLLSNLPSPTSPPSPPPLPSLPSYLTHTPQPVTPPEFCSIESSVDHEQSSTLFSQRNLSFNGFDKMWTLSLNSVIRTIVLGGQTSLPGLDSANGDVS